jgi:large conductance mechanosensitive channel
MSSTDQNRHDFRQDLGRVGGYAKNTLGGFRTFILRGNVVDLAIGIVIGAAFTSVVTSLVADVITPLIPLPGKNSLSSLAIALPSFYPKNSAIHIGLFINALISFLIVALVLYFFIVRPVTALMSRYNPPVVAAPTTRDCPYCLQAIPLQATRCAFCTSPVPPVGAPVDPAAIPQQGRRD